MKKTKKNTFAINENLQLNMDSKSTRLNNNMALIGASGAGKTTLMMGNYLQNEDCSMVIVDVKGDLYRKAKSSFKKKGYTVEVIDLVHPEYSMGYNPFTYVRKDYEEQDLMNICSSLFPLSNFTRDPYWEHTSLEYLRSVVAYTYYVLSKKNLKTVFELVNAIQYKNNGNTFKYLLEEIRDNPHYDFIQQHFNSVDVNGDRTGPCIQSTLLSKINHFNCSKILDMFENNQIHLEYLGSKKSVLFIEISDYSTVFHPIINILLDQILGMLFEKADENENSALSLPTYLFLDDFSTYQIHDMPTIISNCRSRNIAIHLSLQSLSQLYVNYGEQAGNIIIQNCDRVLYFGGNDAKTISFLTALTGYQSYYFADLKPGELVFYQRGKEVDKTKFTFFENTRYCIWNLKKEKRKKHIKEGKKECPDVPAALDDLEPQRPSDKIFFTISLEKNTLQAIDAYCHVQPLQNSTFGYKSTGSNGTDLYYLSRLSAFLPEDKCFDVKLSIETYDQIISELFW